MRLRAPARTQKNTTVRALLPRGDVPGNPIDTHLLQMISLQLKLTVSASQGLASGCKATEQKGAFAARNGKDRPA